jgi:ubiquinone/menaquinone biosynthesis C-methylase UbiE
MPWDSEVIAVDDASTDDSLRTLCERARRHPWLRVVHNRFRKGQHASVITGMERSRGDLVLTMDADLEDAPEFIPKLVASLGPRRDMVAAFRAGRARSRARTAISWLLNSLLRYTRGSRLRDNGSMMRLYRRRLCEVMVRWGRRRPFVPALALELAKSYGDVGVSSGALRGGSRYGFGALLHVARQLARSLPPTFENRLGQRPGPFFELYWSDRYRRCRKAHEYRHALSEAQRAARTYAEPVLGRRLLELGAGLGDDARSLREQGARVIALDSCKRVLTQWDGAGCEKVVGRAEALPFARGVFDRVWGRAVLMHVELLSAVEECRRVLGCRGNAVFMEPMKFHPLVVFYRALWSVGRYSRPRPLAIRDVETVGKMFRRYAHQEFYLLGALSAAFHALGGGMGAGSRKRLLAADEWLLCRFPALRALAWICVMSFEK